MINMYQKYLLLGTTNSLVDTYFDITTTTTTPFGV